MNTKLLSVGFTKKSCQDFFKLLIDNKVKRIIDTRINNTSQLAGFTKYPDLVYIAKLHNIDYLYREDMAPSKELLKRYRDKKVKMPWQEYTKVYLSLIRERKVIEKITNIQEFNNSCFLCSEHKAKECHRSLLLDKIKEKFKNIEIIHL